MKSLGVGLGLVFGCLFLAVSAEIFYLLWRKKRVISREVEEDEEEEADLFHFIFRKKSSSSQRNNNGEACLKDRKVQNGEEEEEEDLELGESNFIKKAFGEETVDQELMHLHNLAGPPRFLFTIKEETMEDLESEDGKSHRSGKGSRRRSLSLLLGSPTASPLNDSYFCHGFNPLFELESELHRFRSSPPPTFKFLRDAEDKLLKKLVEEGGKKGLSQNSVSVVEKKPITEDTEGSFLGFIVGKNKAGRQLTSGSSQVLPLDSPLIRSMEKKT